MGLTGPGRPRCSVCFKNHTTTPPVLLLASSSENQHDGGPPDKCFKPQADPALTQHSQAGTGKAQAKGRQSPAFTQSQPFSCTEGNSAAQAELTIFPEDTTQMPALKLDLTGQLSELDVRNLMSLLHAQMLLFLLD